MDFAYLCMVTNVTKAKLKEMKPIDFPQSTKVLQRPGTMSETECQSLPVWNDGKQCVSCWKPTIKERIKILLGGNVWLGVLSGKTQPPVFVTGERVFENHKETASIVHALQNEVCKFLNQSIITHVDEDGSTEI